MKYELTIGDWTVFYWNGSYWINHSSNCSDEGRWVFRMTLCRCGDLAPEKVLQMVRLLEL